MVALSEGAAATTVGPGGGAGAASTVSGASAGVGGAAAGLATLSVLVAALVAVLRPGSALAWGRVSPGVAAAVTSSAGAWG